MILNSIGKTESYLLKTLSVYGIIFSMKWIREPLSLNILTLFGFILFFTNFQLSNIMFFFIFSLFLLSLTPIFKNRKEISLTFFYFSSGLLILPMRLFYWDSFDFDIRVKYLFYLSLLFALFSFIKKSDLLKIFVEWFNSKKLKKRLIIIFLFSEIIFIFASYINVKRGVVLVGDEPHYLVISQSIAKDGDLNVFNQYARDIYRDFINYRLQHHARVGRGFKKWYSFHLPGLSLTLAPFFITKIPIPLLYFLIRIYLGLFGSLIAVFAYIISIKLLKNIRLALFVIFVFIFTSPVFFYAFHIFAESQVLLLLLISIYMGFFTDKGKKIHIFFSGFFLGITVLWGLKYIIFIGIFTLFFLARTIKRKNYKEASLFVISPVFFLLLFFAYLYFAYGNFSPMSIYTGVMSESQTDDYFNGIKNINFKNRIETLPDYFFDQRDGLLLYNPFYFFFFPGLLIAIKKYKKYKGFLLISTASFIYMFYHGYSTVRPGFCPQARYLMPITWTLMLFAVIYYLESENGYMKRVFLYVPIYSVSVVLYQIFNPFTLYQTTTHNYLDRSGLMFQKLSNIYINISNLLPSFIKVDGNERYLPNILFIIFFVSLLIFSLKRTGKPGKSNYAALLFLILFAVLSLFPRIPLYNPVRVRTSSGLAFILHGNLYPKLDTKNNAYVDLATTSRVTLSTIKKIKSVVFIIKGKISPGSMFDIFNYDSKPEIISEKSRNRLSFLIKEPLFKKFRGRYYYSFNFVPRENFKRAIRSEIVPN